MLASRVQAVLLRALSLLAQRKPRIIEYMLEAVVYQVCFLVFVEIQTSATIVFRSKHKNRASRFPC